MDAGILVAIFFSLFTSVGLWALQPKADAEKARQRRLAEHQMNARLLRMNIS